MREATGMGRDQDAISLHNYISKRRLTGPWKTYTWVIKLVKGLFFFKKIYIHFKEIEKELISFLKFPKKMGEVESLIFNIENYISYF